ncbi:RrF2 family transcriptional regulator [Oleiharenicola lentus]|uniref:RrF2 family transcriptional regulator n=1 Tax=Oleiharenicola lentus TaxID=2508720 RepID=UPI003F66C564
MKLSKRGEYALRSLINLGIGAKVGRSLIRVSELAKAEDLPVKFLEQVMQQLREAGFVASERGKHGGYRLAKPAAEIPIGAIVRLIDGPLAPIGCVSQSAYEPCNCPDETHCGLRMLMLDVRNAIAAILDRYTLADVVEVTTRRMAVSGLPLPYTEAIRANLSVTSTPPKRAKNRAIHSPTEGVIHQLLGDYAI